MALRNKKPGKVTIEVVTANLTDIKHNPDNPRQISEKDMERLVKSLQEFPEMMKLREIVVDENMMVLGGNMRLKALQKTGAKSCLAKIVKGLTREQKREFVIKDNAAFGTWDMDTLANAWGDLPLIEWGVDLPENWLGDQNEEPIIDARAQIDRAEELQTEWGTKKGQLWQWREHLLYCGDARVEKDVQRVTLGRKMDLCVTSPPYNIGVKYLQHQDRTVRTEYLNFVETIAKQIFEILEYGRFLIWNVGVTPKTYPAHQIVRLENVGFQFYRQIVWEKAGVPYPIFQSTMKTKRARHYKPNYVHEMMYVFEKEVEQSEGMQQCPLCDGDGKVATRDLYCGDAFELMEMFVKGSKPELGKTIKIDQRYKNDIWKIAQSMATVDLETVGTKSTGLTKGKVFTGGTKSHMMKTHPAAYPVELPLAFIRFLTNENEMIFEPFCGSGTTILACERLKRKCRAIELSPGYVAVTLQRLYDATGEKPTNMEKDSID